MLAASVIVLAMCTTGPNTPLGYFKAAVRDKNVERKCELIEGGLSCLFFIDADKDGDELNRLFTLYLGFLTADLPFDINLTIAQSALQFPLSMETRSLAAEAIDGYLGKLKGSKEDVIPPQLQRGFLGVGNGLKPSEWLEEQYVNRLREGVERERWLRWVFSGGPKMTAQLPVAMIFSWCRSIMQPRRGGGE